MIFPQSAGIQSMTDAYDVCDVQCIVIEAFTMTPMGAGAHAPLFAYNATITTETYADDDARRVVEGTYRRDTAWVHRPVQKITAHLACGHVIGVHARMSESHLQTVRITNPANDVVIDFAVRRAKPRVTLVVTREDSDESRN